jgi:hypothetical protein
MSQSPAKTSDASVLKTAATALGSAAGSVAALAKSALPHPKVSASEARKSGRFVRKDKARLPRKQKKALAKKRAVSKQVT